MSKDQNITKQKIDALVAKFDQELAAYKQKRNNLIAGLIKKAELREIEKIRQQLSGKK